MLEELKNYLDVTWDDEDLNAKLSGILERAMGIIKGYACNVDIDYDSDTLSKQLLFDLCRYIYNDAYEDFGTNFAGELLLTRARYRLESESETEEEETTDETEAT